MPGISMGRVDRFIGRKPRVRRWVDWFFLPCLAVAGVAWWFESKALLAPAAVLFGLSLVVGVVDGFRTGSVDTKVGHCERQRSPVLFWFFCILYGVLGVGSLYAGVDLLLTNAAR